ncbi:hypothetical protein [Companilactobacillus keshanensis]|uniref:Cysteine desulfurase n=1 Tax=Companilactobacillus keshanensis TaxID=2486003 RepID=A0ABW4BU52_9LACO|nr:hypothetical protein [Companilactobacillus keshanensis]
MSTKAQVLGDKDFYEINPEIKKYALLDVGFQETKQGNFRLERPINGNSPYDARYVLKITINKDFSNFKMATTDKSGLHNLNIFKSKNTDQEVEDFRYLMNFLIEKNILVKR